VEADILKLLKNIRFAIWMYWGLIYLRVWNKNVRKYRSEGDFERERREILKVTSAWSRRIIEKLNIDLKAEGHGALPAGPVLFVSNHQGYADIPVFFAAITSKQFGFVAKDEMRRLPLFGGWIRNIRSVFIFRNNTRASVRGVSEAVKFLKQGFSLAVFPEGTRSKGASPGEFKKGSLRLALRAKVPVVPVTLSGSWRVFEEKGCPQPATVKFYIHPAIETAELSKRDAGVLAERVEEIILRKLREWENIEIEKGEMNADI
jgi:1-acyl-sn-glycerol-3-phosphate acyltransferase